ncbi:MAG: NAD(P)/FAD-dependent oxidoreductase [Saprospiraceae bacterium]|nr:NAD(P)/FAD-dependent oxidoreductase [Saprospiraceae bacterium]
MPLNIPDPGYKRIVIIGGGFAGLNLASKLANSVYQVILIDKNNYHQFQPLFYQVAMAGLEPSSIIFPFRKVFQKSDNVFFRVAEMQEVFPTEKYIMTDKGRLKYDFLVVAVGADTNFLGNQRLMDNVIPMKSVSEALYLRNAILEDYEAALLTTDEAEREKLMDVIIVGGGPTGVEVAGALAEMRENILPKEYKELNYRQMDIILVQGGDKVLNTMSANASTQARKFLEELGVKIMFGDYVSDYDGETVKMKSGAELKAKKVIWAAGIVGNPVNGIPAECFVRGKRLKVNSFCEVEGLKDIFAIGDIAYMPQEKYTEGHPQVAQVAIQMAKRLSQNFLAIAKGGKPQAFAYKDLGSMATIGRHKAVVDLPFWHFQGIFAWFVWLFVHLRALIGVKNKVFVFINWVWSYVTYDQALRLIIRPRVKNRTM